MHEYNSPFRTFDFRAYTSDTWYFIVPNILHVALFYGAPLVALFSMVMIVLGAIKKKNSKYFVCWIVAFLLMASLTFLTWTGHIVGQYQFGG